MNIRFKRSKKLEQSKRLPVYENPNDDPFLYAIFRKDHRKMRLFLSNEADVDRINRPVAHGVTPLTIAVLNKDMEAVKILIEYGAAPSIYSKFTNKSRIPSKVALENNALGRDVLDLACKTDTAIFNFLQKKAFELSPPYPFCIDGQVNYQEASPEKNTTIAEHYEADNNTNTLKKTINQFVIAATTMVPTTVAPIVEYITNTTSASANASDSSMQNRLINSIVSESTDWSTEAVVGAVSLGALVILSGVGGICYYLSKKTESYNNSLVSSRIIRN